MAAAGTLVRHRSGQAVAREEERFFLRVPGPSVYPTEAGFLLLGATWAAAVVPGRVLEEQFALLQSESRVGGI